MRRSAARARHHSVRGGLGAGLLVLGAGKVQRPTPAPLPPAAESAARMFAAATVRLAQIRRDRRL
jgi:hypothetical protein